MATIKIDGEEQKCEQKELEGIWQMICAPEGLSQKLEEEVGDTCPLIVQIKFPKTKAPTQRDAALVMACVQDQIADLFLPSGNDSEFLCASLIEGRRLRLQFPYARMTLDQAFIVRSAVKKWLLENTCKSRADAAVKKAPTTFFRGETMRWGGAYSEPADWVQLRDGSMAAPVLHKRRTIEQVRADAPETVYEDVDPAHKVLFPENHQHCVDGHVDHEMFAGATPWPLFLSVHYYNKALQDKSSAIQTGALKVSSGCKNFASMVARGEAGPVDLAPLFAEDLKASGDYLLDLTGSAEPSHYVWDEESLLWYKGGSSKLRGFIKRRFGEYEAELRGSKVLDTSLEKLMASQRWRFMKIASLNECITSMIDYLSEDRHYVAKIEKETKRLDSAAHLVPLAGQVYDYKRKELRDRTKQDMFTLALESGYIPKSERDTQAARDCEMFLEGITLGDQTLVMFLKQLIGYCLSGYIHRQEFYTFWGVGSNGKSLLFLVLGKLFGKLCAPAKGDVFAENKGKDVSGATTHLNRFERMRLILASEMSAHVKANEPLIKLMTGGEDMIARKNHAEERVFSIWSKQILATNHEMTISNDHGIKRRLVSVPFKAKFVASEDFDASNPTHRIEDSHLKERLETPEVLSYLLSEAIDSVDHTMSFQLPECVKQKTKEYFAGQDPYAAFVDRFLERKKGAHARWTLGPKDTWEANVYETFTDWWAGEVGGRMPPTTGTLKENLIRLGFDIGLATKRRITCVKDCALIASAEEREASSTVVRKTKQEGQEVPVVVGF